MKKLLRAVLAAALPLCIGLQALAAENSGTIGKNGSQNIDVTAKYTAVSAFPASYSVDIQWADMTFTYTEKKTHVWNASDHSYDTQSQAKWDKTEATVTVTNHSNVDVDVTVSYTPVADTGIIGILQNASGTLQAGIVGDYGGADSMTATLSISGTPEKTVTTSGVKIGSIKITIE